jgi:hypothetical protein
MFASIFDGRSPVVATRDATPAGVERHYPRSYSKAGSGVQFRYYADSGWRSVHYWTFSGLIDWVDGGSGNACLVPNVMKTPKASNLLTGSFAFGVAGADLIAEV